MIFRKAWLYYAFAGIILMYACSDKENDSDLLNPKSLFAKGWDSVHIGTRPIYDIQFPDPLIGFFVGNDVYKSIDGGKTWNQLNAQPTYYEGYQYASFPNVLNGWVVGYDGSIIRTNDGGKNWMKLQFSPKLLKTGKPFQIRFLDQYTGFIICDSGLLKSSDGGTTWAKVCSTLAGSALFFIDEQNGWIAEKDGILRTTDGINFTKTIVGKRFPSIFFLNKLDGFALDNSGTVFETNDGGVTWRLKHKVDVGEFAQDIQFFDKDNGYVSGTDGVAKISGMNVTSVVHAPDLWLYEMYFFNQDRGFVGSAFNTLIRFNAPK